MKNFVLKMFLVKFPIRLMTLELAQTDVWAWDLLKRLRGEMEISYLVHVFSNISTTLEPT